MEQQDEVIKLEPLRKQKIRDGITRLLEENVGKENYDGNRLEQELVYYIEKIDISEEQIRLKNHCDYFLTMLDEKEEAKGKKLSFLLQEIGREINTTGSKAYDSTIQKCVVQMKDDLEKAKEQILNAVTGTDGERICGVGVNAWCALMHLSQLLWWTGAGSRRCQGRVRGLLRCRR